jgi:subtilisin family serine protease
MAREASGTRTRLGAFAAAGTPIVYIHGIGSKPPPAQLKLQWDLALFGRDMGPGTVMAYWADLLHSQTQEASFATRSGRREGSIDVAASLEEAGVDAGNADAQAMVAGLLRAAGVQSGMRRAQALPLPGFLRKPITRAFLHALVKDAAAYFFKPTLRAQMRARLTAALPREGAFVLVAHSLGSVISLEMLAERAKRDDAAKVDLFLTVGSPLGIREVQDVLSCPLEIPAGVQRWWNFADIIDPVALDKGIATDFVGRGRLFDELIVNDELRRLEGVNPHSAAGYLSHPKVRRLVHAATRFDMFSKFLMARDVSTRMGVDQRHPVLIEILEPGYRALDESQQEMTALEQSEGALDLRARVARAAAGVEQAVREYGERYGEADAVEAASIDPLQRFVSARLRPLELATIAERHRDLRVYRIWKSARKRKLARAPASAVQADAAAVSYGADGRGIRWAVLDTGVRRDHPHFVRHENIVEVWDCTKRGPPQAMAPAYRDPDGHGSHVAGVIAGEAPDGAAAPRGIAPKTKLVIYKVLNDSGEGEDAWIIKALDHIAQQNENSSRTTIDGLNLSLGGPYDSTVYGCGHSPVCAELRRQWRAGVLVVVAAGNEGQLEVTTPDGEIDLHTSLSIGDPANLEDCIAVGSVNGDQPHLYGVSAFSSRGPTTDGRVKPDVVAPGERILSCNSGYRKTGNRHVDLYREDTGTSMAAPHVAGLLAAFLSVRQEFRGRPDEVKRLLLDTCIDLRRDRYHQGAGLPNLMRMLLDT